MPSNMFLSIFLLGLAVCHITGIFTDNCKHFKEKPLRVGSFNIQRLGASKFSNKTIAKRIINIMSHFDILLLQEVQDSSQKGLKYLRYHLRRKRRCSHWDFISSQRLGRNSYREQYVFFYRQSLTAFKGTFQHPDPKDVFAREPFAVKFEYYSKLEKHNVTLTGVHITPTKAKDELDNLDETIKVIANHWPDSDGVITMGDFNADCGYLAKKYRTSLPIFTDKAGFTSLIPDTADTTVKGTSCAYDRIIVYGDKIDARDAKVYDFKAGLHLTQASAEAISDHFPVEFTLY